MCSVQVIETVAAYLNMLRANDAAAISEQVIEEIQALRENEFNYGDEVPLLPLLSSHLPRSSPLLLTRSHLHLILTFDSTCDLQEEPSENVDNLSQAMQLFEAEHWLCGEELFLAPPTVVRRWALPCLALLTARRMNVVLLSKHFAPKGTTGSPDELSQHAAGSEHLKHKNKGAEVQKEKSASVDAAGGELTEPWFGTRYSVRGSELCTFKHC